jgi:hypothetical protein
MKNLTISTNPEVELVFKEYPEKVQRKILNLRRLIIEAASETEEISNLEETLKWSEPSYLTKFGSTIRIDWKKNKPDQYAIYFKCTSKLVPTFKMVFNDVFNFEGDRAIIFGMNDKIPETQLKQCIITGLTYHKVKTLPMLGLG